MALTAAEAEAAAWNSVDKDNSIISFKLGLWFLWEGGRVGRRRRRRRGFDLNAATLDL